MMVFLFPEHTSSRRTRCSPSLSHLPFLFALVADLEEFSPDLCDEIPPPSSSSLSDSAKILRIWDWMTAMIARMQNLRTLPLMRPWRFKCLPNTQIEQILRSFATACHINITMSSDAIQKEKGMQWKSVQMAAFFETSPVQIPKTQTQSVEMPIEVLVSSAPPLLVPQLCREIGCVKTQVLLRRRRKKPRH